MKKLFICILLLTVVKGYSQTADTAEIYFDYKVSKVTDRSSRRLDSLRFARVLLPGHKTTIYGYTDYVGGDEYNRGLSAERAKNVKAYLVSLGLDEGDIVHCEGKGIAKANRAPVAGELGYGEDRKVLIIMERAPSKTSKIKPAITKTADNNPNNSTANPEDPNNPANKKNKPKTGTSVAGDPNNPDNKTTKPKTGTSVAGDPNNQDNKTTKPKTGTSVAGDPNNPGNKTTKPKTGTSVAGDPNNPDNKTTKPKTGTSVAGDPNNPDNKTTKPKTGTSVAGDPNNPDSKTTKPKTGTSTAGDPNNPANKSGTPKAGDPGSNTKLNPKTKSGNPVPADVSKTTANTEKPKNATGPKTDGAKPGTDPATGQEKPKPVTDGSQTPKPVTANSVTAVAVSSVTSTVTNTQPPAPPKMPKPSSEPVIPLSANAKIPRKVEKNIANLDPKKLIIGEIIPLNNIYFAPASNEMLRQSEPSLEQLFSFLKTNTNLAVEIQGRICCLSPIDGTDEPDGHGSTRSTARAKNIYDYLVNKGIDKNRLTYSGLGNTKPSVYPERTEYDRDLNRRATMKIIYK